MSSFTEWLSLKNWIEPKDTVYVVSDMLPLAKQYRQNKEKLVLEDIIKELQKIVTDEGTLLFPTFNWDFCKAVSFDYYNTPVKTGALPKAALAMDPSSRTHHPLYSFSVWGKHRDELLSNNAVDAFGVGTIFEKMDEWNAKVLVIGLNALEGVTYIHHVEQIVGVPYRYNKNFTAFYIDENGDSEERTYRMYVRDLDMDPRHINGFSPLEEKMKAQGIIKSEKYGDVACHIMSVRALGDAVKEDILHNDSALMYRYNHI